MTLTGCCALRPFAVVPNMGHCYHFKRGERVTIICGRLKGATGVVEGAVFQRPVDYPDEYAPDYHVVLAAGQVVTVRWDQVSCQRAAFN